MGYKGMQWKFMGESSLLEQVRNKCLTNGNVSSYLSCKISAII